jgi:hypothetical protein
MKETGFSAVLGRLLDRVTDGAAEALLDSAPLATLDAHTRDLAVQVTPLLDREHPVRPLTAEHGPMGLWEMRGVPGALAQRGWRVALYDGNQELMALGRGTSPLTGHVHVAPTALWKLRKLV